MSRLISFESLKFLLQAVVAGLAIAFLVLVLYPELLPREAAAPTARPGEEPASGTGSGPYSYHSAIEKVSPAVVNVYSTRMVQRPTHPLFQDPMFRRFFGDPPEQEPQYNTNLGSGVILNRDGFLLTNAHVIEQASEIRITLTDGRQALASVVGIDEATDLAVLQIDLENPPIAPIGDSNRLVVGDVVLAIGNPYDFGQTVTQGIVSAVGRQRLGISAIEDFIQTDADINLGNSGGALVTARGELIGINTAIYSRSGGSQGIGFAIPINLAMDVMRQIVDNGFVKRGYLGIVPQMVPRDMVEESNLEGGGVLISAVMSDGPAARAGVMPGDILTGINDQPVYTPQQVIQTISQQAPGEDITLDIVRGWDHLNFTARVVQRPSFSQ